MTDPGDASASAAPPNDQIPRSAALARGVLGWLVLVTGLGVSIGLVTAADQRIGLSGATLALLQAGLMSALVIPVIWLLRSRLDLRSMAGLGWARPVLPPVLIGLGVGLLSGVVAWLPAAALGWIRFDQIDALAVGRFLALNGLALLFYEALPEELALRGYTWTNLRDGFSTTIASVLTTLLFPLGGVLVTGIAAGITAVLGTQAVPIRWFPGDPAVYVLQLTLFGLALIAARRLPLRGALFTAVGFHWMQLTITRALLGGLGWVPSGLEVTFVAPDAIALVLVHIVLGGLGFVLIRRLQSARQLVSG